MRSRPYATPQLVRKLVERYCREVKGGAASFTVGEPIAWNAPIPTVANSGGCYAIYSVDDALIYVGMSEDRIIARILRHQKSAAKGVAFWNANPPVSYQLISGLKPWDAAGLEVYITKKTRRRKCLRQS